MAFFKMLLLLPGLCIAFSRFCSAQVRDPDAVPLIYVSGALGNGTHGTARVSMDVIADGRHSWSFGFVYGVGTTPDKPGDFDRYNAGWFDFNFSGHKRPLDYYRLFNFSAGRLFVRRGGRARLHAKAGLLLGAADLAGSFVFVPDTSGGWFDNSGYEYTYRTATVYGGQIQVILETLSNAVFGLRTSATLSCTNTGFQAGVDLGFNLGRLRPRLSNSLTQ